MGRNGTGIHLDIEQYQKRFEDIVIDAGGRDSVELRSDMMAADKFCMPLRPSQFEAWTAETVNRLIDTVLSLGKKIEPCVFVNLAPPNSKTGEVEEIRSFWPGFRAYA